MMTFAEELLDFCRGWLSLGKNRFDLDKTEQSFDRKKYNTKKP